jgi:hypothetical protein
MISITFQNHQYLPEKRGREKLDQVQNQVLEATGDTVPACNLDTIERVTSFIFTE